MKFKCFHRAINCVIIAKEKVKIFKVNFDMPNIVKMLKLCLQSFPWVENSIRTKFGASI